MRAPCIGIGPVSGLAAAERLPAVFRYNPDRPDYNQQWELQRHTAFAPTPRGRKSAMEAGTTNMITTVTLNPCIDLSVRVPALRPGELNLVSDTRTDISGKGINVSVVLRALGLATIATGISFDGDDAKLQNHLEMHTISRRFAMAHGNIRTNIKIYDETTGQMTEVNHRGHPVGQPVVDEYLRELRACAENSEIVVFSGRVPAAADDGIYRQSIRSLKGLPVKCVVDAEGAPLREALRQKPYLIKPNLHELRTILRCATDTDEEILAACRTLIEKGVGVVCLSMGERGAMIVDRDAAFFAPALDVVVRGLCGAGDSMVAGLCKGIKEGAAIDTMLRYAVAAASASLLREGTLLCRADDFVRLLPQVKPQKLAYEPLPALPQPKKKAAAKTTVKPQKNAAAK